MRGPSHAERGGNSLRKLHRLVSYTIIVTFGKKQNLLRRTLISTGVLVQVQLVIVLGIPPLPGGLDVRGDGLLIPFLANFFRHILGDLKLFIAVCEDGAAVLRSDIRALAVCRRGIMQPIKKF
jgi:hypothetical protein